MVEQKIKQGYKISELGIIPKDWNVQPVEDAFEICNALRFPINKEKRKKMLGQYPYYGPTGIQDYINEFRVKGEYALIGEDGDHFLKWEKQPMTILVNGKFNVNNHAHLVKGTKNLTKWFYWFFVNRDISLHLTKQGAGRLKLTKAEFSKIPCIIPPLPEQIIISDVLENITDVIRYLGNLIGKKKNIKLGVMQELLTGKRRLEGFREDWETTRLGELLNYEQPTKYMVTDTNYDDAFTIPVLTAGQTFVLGYTNENTGIFHDVPVIIFDDFTTATKFVTFPFKVKSSAMKILKAKNNEVNLEFIYEIMQIIDFIVGDHKRYWLSEYQFLEQKIPKIEEQNSIMKILSDMKLEITQLEKQVDKYIQLKKGMMQKLLTGEIRLK